MPAPNATPAALSVRESWQVQRLINLSEPTTWRGKVAAHFAHSICVNVCVCVSASVHDDGAKRFLQLFLRCLPFSVLPPVMHRAGVWKLVWEMNDHQRWSIGGREI